MYIYMNVSVDKHWIQIRNNFTLYLNVNQYVMYFNIYCLILCNILYLYSLFFYILWLTPAAVLVLEINFISNESISSECFHICQVDIYICIYDIYNVYHLVHVWGHLVFYRFLGRSFSGPWGGSRGVLLWLPANYRFIQNVG